MKTIYKSLLLTLFCFVMQSGYSQTLGEAIQYSFYDYVGTARMAGAGGAFGALGGDQGAVSINPASLGTYRKSEFVISPMYFDSRTNSTFAGKVTTENPSVDLSAINMGFVFSSKGRSGSKWKTSNIAISYNKVTDFERNMSFDGVSEGTIVERFAERANGNDLNSLDNFEAGLAYDALALYDEGEDLIYEYDAVENEEIEKSQTISAKGGISELNFAWAGNYDGKIQFGFSLGIPILRAEHSKSYEEKTVNGVSRFVSLGYQESLKTTGSGINLKLGIIAIPTPAVRVGIAIASPTSFDLSDTYSTSMQYRYIGNDDVLQNGSAESPIGNFSYDYTTPWKATGSLAYLVNTSNIKGFLSAEVDYLDYTAGFYDLVSDSDDGGDPVLEKDLNNQIDTQLKNGINLRLGGELGLDIYRFRAGYQLVASPYFKDQGKYFSGFTLGGGLRFDKFFFDIAFKTNTNAQGYLPYQSLNENNLQLVEMETTKNYLSTTFGFKF